MEEKNMKDASQVRGNVMVIHYNAFDTIMRNLTDMIAYAWKNDPDKTKECAEAVQKVLADINCYHIVGENVLQDYVPSNFKDLINHHILQIKDLARAVDEDSEHSQNYYELLSDTSEILEDVYYRSADPDQGSRYIDEMILDLIKEWMDTGMGSNDILPIAKVGMLLRDYGYEKRKEQK